MRNPDQILSVAQMRAAEDALTAAGTSVEALMDRAGRGVADWVWRIAGRQRVTVLCGPGNNGGDGYVVAQSLLERGGDAVVVAAGEPRTDAARNARALFAGPVLDSEAIVQGEVFVDCLFGSGLSRPLAPEHVALLARLAQSHRRTVAVDVPSGVDADSGAFLSDDLPACDLTLALGAWKHTHSLMPAVASMGMLQLVDIGVTQQAGAAHVLVRPSLRAPEADAHKYRRGLVAVVGGAMPGAAGLAAEACARGGCGYVRLSAPKAVRTSHAIVQADKPDFTKAKAVLVGPGLGRDDAAWQKLHDALGSGVPVMADADALWLLGEKGPAGLTAPAIITPHEGEFAKMFPELMGNKIERARQAASQSGSVIVYKGPDTVIAAPDGRVSIAPRASTWLSTAGTGDVLAGLCASRLGVTGDPLQAACEAVWLHGEAARLAGPAFAADDLVAHLPQAMAACL
ncbi:NAD(P)H-hydrate dehydratase [Novosphingobium sp. 9U]|uniref:NAD(P)H-hydrate dehydratase n=1 Tax=Novosphingobium sp. 9U TaxID=2653158 RepID=UPI0012F20E0C|nr:NAD(P)H-hydrate dehydratase [Novosphingobium sp. 9U]VWX51996.1 ADP-dependent (S)-NAD(P)H-hydrate dehydratase,NAD(P)H-hydrate epimerase [Novosphingobium sp. 9U]